MTKTSKEKITKNSFMTKEKNHRKLDLTRRKWISIDLIKSVKAEVFGFFLPGIAQVLLLQNLHD